MPQIPRASDISRTQVSGQQRVQVADISAVGTGAQQLSNELGRVGDDMYKRKTSYEMAQARTELLKAATIEGNAYNDDEDYPTIPDRYTNNMKTHMESAASLISDPAARAQFNLDADLQFTQGLEKIKNHAKGVEGEYQRAYIVEGMASNRDAALNGDTLAAMETNDHLIDSAVDMNYLEPARAAQMKLDWRNDTARAKIEQLPPEQRLEALQEEWAQNIPSEVRAQLTRVAEDESVLEQSIEAADAASDLSFEEGFESLKGLDPKVRERAESRLSAHWNRRDAEIGRQKRDAVTEQKEMHQAYFNEVRLNGLDPETIPEEELNRMEPSIVENMMVAHRNYIRDQDPVTPRETLDELYSIYQGGRGSPLELSEYFMEISHTLSRSDYEQWAEVSTESFDGIESNPVFTGTQMINSKVMEVTGGMANRGMEAKYRRQFERYVFEYRNDHEGRDPDGNEQRIAIDKMMLELPTAERYFGTDPTDYTLWDDMTPEKQGQALSYIQSLDPEAFETAKTLLGENGNTYTNRELAYVFTTLTDAEDKRP